jgi:hypothetical protein
MYCTNISMEYTATIFMVKKFEAACSPVNIDQDLRMSQYTQISNGLTSSIVFE